MKEKKIKKEDALSLIEKEESHFFDHKALEISGAKTQKIAIAFANADGGEFLIGIKDPKDEADPNKRWNGAKPSKILTLTYKLFRKFNQL
ncbi:ATP-binding protein [Mucilaginibacter sp. L196]|uniref:ATP-binding protein n=1 Tax=Mucilaginibacter sp. L196 TaxID=1641870 RepID=UPI001C204A75|nr:ATP-binding protein [Mucilaginibacter sp. L196]